MIRKKVGKRMRPHPFSRQKFAISLANIYVSICFAVEFAGLKRTYNDNRSLAL